MATDGWTKEEWPLSQTTGYGIPYADPNLAVNCGTCKAPEGVPCAKRGGGTHTTRQDKIRKFYAPTHRLAMKLENEAYARDRSSGLWRASSTPHQCGTLGPHLLTDCTPTAEVAR